MSSVDQADVELPLLVVVGRREFLRPCRNQVAMLIGRFQVRDGFPALLLDQDGADRRSEQQEGGEGSDRDQCRAVLAGELPQLVRRRRRAGLDGVAGEVPLDVAGEAVGGLVPPGAVLVQRLHHDPVELAADQLRQPGRLGPPLRRQRGERSPESLSRVEGLGGSSSRIWRRISEYAALRTFSFSSGVEPVSSS